MGLRGPLVTAQLSWRKGQVILGKLRVGVLVFLCLPLQHRGSGYRELHPHTE